MITRWVQRLGYKIRPYDMLSDQRRWFWQSATRCGLPTCRKGYGWCVLMAGHPGWCEVAGGPRDPVNLGWRYVHRLL